MCRKASPAMGRELRLLPFAPVLHGHDSVLCFEEVLQVFGGARLPVPAR